MYISGFHQLLDGKYFQYFLYITQIFSLSLFNISSQWLEHLRSHMQITWEMSREIQGFVACVKAVLVAVVAC